MRKFLFVLFCLVLVLPVVAQENETGLSPYEIALKRIQAYGHGNVLDLSGLGLSELPPEIGYLENLFYLHLEYNSLSELPPEIGNLTKLRMINLHSNALMSLPPEIGSFPDLTTLYIGDNQLTSLPPEIGQLSELRELYAFGNQLSSLPPEIGQLEELQILYLPRNQLQTLPEEILQLKNLCVLELGENQLESIPRQLAELPLLSAEGPCPPPWPQGLYLYNNPGLSIPQDVLDGGAARVMAYYKNEAWLPVREFVLRVAGSLGLLISLMLGLRLWGRIRQGKKKHEAF